MGDYIKFHKGEKTIQESINFNPNPETVRRILRTSILPQAFPYIESQTTAIVSTTDANQNIWTSILLGEPGFLLVKDENLLVINLKKLRSTRQDILFKNITLEANKIGFLFINTESRSRYRLNGYASITGDVLLVKVAEAYTNCPKYIQKRKISIPSQPNTDSNSKKSTGTTLTTEQREWIRTADTFFLGSTYKEGHMDASHRGGPVGFIELLKDDTLKVPDYVGNNLFNTLGNFLLHPKSGLTFIDFEKGNTLQLTGSIELFFDEKTEKDLKLTTGTGRYWTFKPEQWILTENHHQVTWEFVDFSPFNPSI